MKLNEITKTIYGQNNLDCLVKLENINGKIYFSDFTKNKFFQVWDNEQLNRILQDNKF